MLGLPSWCGKWGCHSSGELSVGARTFRTPSRNLNCWNHEYTHPLPLAFARTPPARSPHPHPPRVGGPCSARPKSLPSGNVEPFFPKFRQLGLVRYGPNPTYPFSVHRRIANIETLPLPHDPEIIATESLYPATK